ncbi:MAG: apolipoprotein N-acyltransferase [Clostridia bacterium]|nr:apolipoprotein N-acyltransferase [Clostridia bacterium]
MKKIICPENSWVRFAYLTVSGLLSGICITFPSVLGAILEWISFIPAALVFYSVLKSGIKTKSFFWGSFWLIYSQNLIVYHWFVSFYPLEFTGMSKLAAAGVVVIAILGLSLLAAIFGGVIGLVLLLASKSELAQKYPILYPFLASVSYALCEWIRTQFWFGVPWSRLALGQLTDLPPLTVLSASVFGSYFVTFLIVAVSFLFAQAIFLGKFKIRTVIALSLALINIAIGTLVYFIPSEEHETIKVAVIQGNISSRDKWDTGNRRSSYDIHMDLTREAAAEGADLIIWSETALLSFGTTHKTEMSLLCKEYETNLIIGCLDDVNLQPRNILRLIDSNGELSETVYVKQHLVPFGEYVPMRELVMFLFPPLAEIGMLSEDLVFGEGSNLFSIEHNGKNIDIGGLICFDSIYESLAYQSAADGADLLCVSTNDSWFEDSRAVYMHCEQSRLRAIENRLPVVRSANTGISALITDKGEVIDSLDPLLEGYVIADIPISENTSTSRIPSTLFIVLCSAFLLIPAGCGIYGFMIKKRR